MSPFRWSVVLAFDKRTSRQKLEYLFRAEFEDLVGVRRVPRPVPLPQDDVEVEQEGQVGPAAKPVDPVPVVSAESEVGQPRVDGTTIF
jgi:hypothetical protein